MTPTPTDVVVVTGLSGAGKSTALAALEDLGYHAIENVPPPVLEHAIAACEQAGVKRIALGFGAGVGEFLVGAAEVLERIARGTPERGSPRRVTVVFLDASDDVVLRRFSETRRPHPLAAALQARAVEGAVADVRKAVALEREQLAPLRAMAEVVLDTSGLRVHDLRKRVLGAFQGGASAELRMTARLLSFGFKYGLPSDADLVLDVRFLENPFFVPDLRPLTGRDLAVRSHVLSSPGTARFLELTEELLAFLLPRYEEEGKSYLTVAVGCTGGQHRSVSIAITLAERLATRGHPDLRVVHRELAEQVANTPAPAAVGGSG